MLFSTISTIVFTLASVASASSDSSADYVPVLQRRYNHRQLSSNRAPHQRAERMVKKTKSCSSNHSSGSSGSSSGSGSSSSGNSTYTSTSTGSAPTATGSSNSTSGNSGNGGSASAPSSGTKSGGVVHLVSSQCGANNPTAKPTMTNGPLGEEIWLNCGLNTAKGWNPPKVTWENLIYVTIDEAFAKSPDVWAPCSSLKDKFTSYGQSSGIPPILLMSFAMQESTCSQSNGNKNPYGTSGLFQIAPENCKGMNCRGSVDDNFKAAINVIKSYYQQYDQSVAYMAGAYNGWEKGITLTKIKNTHCGVAQNGDYVHQLLNGWMQGIDGGSLGNIKNCGNYGRKRSLHVPRWVQPGERQGWHF